MNQIMPVGKGVLFVVGDEKVRPEVFEALKARWDEHFPDVPCFVVGPATIVQRGDNELMLFEFTGDVSPTMVAEFQRWWEEVNNSG